MAGTASFEADPSYDQRDAGGFIRLNGLRLRPRRPPTTPRSR